MDQGWDCRRGTSILDSNSGTSCNVLVYIYQRNDMGYLVNTGFVALNGLGTLGHADFCWNDEHDGCLATPPGFSLNQPLLPKP